MRITMDITTPRQLLDLWPTRRALKQAIGLAEGRRPTAPVEGWYRTGRVPGRHWARIVAAAAVTGIEGVTIEGLFDLHERLRTNESPLLKDEPTNG